MVRVMLHAGHPGRAHSKLSQSGGEEREATARVGLAPPSGAHLLARGACFRGDRRIVRLRRSEGRPRRAALPAPGRPRPSASLWPPGALPQPRHAAPHPQQARRHPRHATPHPRQAASHPRHATPHPLQRPLRPSRACSRPGRMPLPPGWATSAPSGKAEPRRGVGRRASRLAESRRRVGRRATRLYSSVLERRRSTHSCPARAVAMARVARRIRGRRVRRSSSTSPSSRTPSSPGQERPCPRSARRGHRADRGSSPLPP